MADAIVDADGPQFEVIEPGIGVLTPNRPDNRNALDWPLFEAFEKATYRIASHPALIQPSRRNTAGQSP